MSNKDERESPRQAASLEERVEELEARLAGAEKHIKDLNHVVYKVLYELGGKEMLARRRVEEKH